MKIKQSEVDKLIKDHTEYGGLPRILEILKNLGNIEIEGDLKPCPFCGSKSHLQISQFLYFVQCINCSAQTRESQEEENVIKEWQKRAK